ncbi:N-acetylmuramoyl-L-alanine amidase [Fodinibius salinus]|uniref:N-acetylmuramoyl-L-alanine amidase n=1 Tax=Fodinibius salinus TaxID=860790 RepID=A0A5D3YLE1_9BACT|nr:N-acetylmuramoyl-L-alanine amidase [Fodinibius salinus]
MYSYNQFLILIVLNCLLLLLSSPLQAQENALQKLSSAERSDGKGYVLRYHLSQQVDSFEVYQPDVDLIQMTLYSNEVDTNNIGIPSDSPIFDEISFYELPNGVGVDIYIAKDYYYDSKAYHDASSNDLLLALTETDREELEYITQDLKPLMWSRLTMDSEEMLVENESIDTAKTLNGDYQKTKDKIKLDVVVIDPGHGGHDPGSIGYKGVKEKDIVLDISKKVGGYIKKYMPGVKVVYTRESDKFIELEERGSIANRAEGDLFVSIHCNSHSSRQAYGTDVFFLGLERSQTALKVMKRENKVVRANNDTEQKKLTQEELLIYELANSGYIASSEQIAGMFENQLDNRAQRHSRGVKQARFVVLYHASMPAVLLETGFISNPSEARYLTSNYGQSIIASAIFRAIRNYKEDYDKSQHFNSK